jgi:F0F1-type ATP synthase membrane subunit b/b'
MLVHPLAKPRPGRIKIPKGWTTLHLAGNLIATLSEKGIVVSKAPTSMKVPDPKSPAGIVKLARDARRLRSMLSKESAMSVNIGDAGGPSEPHSLTINKRVYPISRLVVSSGLVQPHAPIRVIQRPAFSRPTGQFETSIEAPFRLVISPSKQGGWKHALKPVGAEEAEHRVELWHSRLGVRVERGEEVHVSETTKFQRIIRAVWARDRETLKMRNWQHSQEGRRPEHNDLPFRMSLDGADRHILVRQSAETWLGDNSEAIYPQPVDVEKLWLSSQGAWLDLHGSWKTDQYTLIKDPMSAILTWDHIAPMGRDQYVRVTYPGYLYPFGHKAVLVKLTERKMKDRSPSLAGLYMKKFIVVTEPVKRFAHPNLPLTKVQLEPLVTPTLDDPSGSPGDSQDSFFWPKIDFKRYRFIMHCEDQEERPVRLMAPLVWVSDSYPDLANINTAYNEDSDRNVGVYGQDVAFAEVATGGDTMLPTMNFEFMGEAKKGFSIPRLNTARVKIPSIEQLSSVGEVDIKYFQTYLDNGFDSPKNSGEVWAEIVGVPPQLSFGGGKPSGSDRAGGFLQPDLTVAGLSRSKGTVGDLTSTAESKFDPAAFLGNAMPKLFGIVNLVDLLSTMGVNLSDAPNVVSEALDRIASLISDIKRIKETVEEAVLDADRLRVRAAGKAQSLRDQAEQAYQKAQQIEQQTTAAVDDILNKLENLQNASLTTITADLQQPLQALGATLPLVEQAAPLLPPLIRQQLLNLSKRLRAIVESADILDDLFRFFNGLGTSSLETSFRFEWKPKLEPWPSQDHPFLGITDTILHVEKDSLILAVDGRTNGKGEVGVEVLAELRDFALYLLPGETLVKFKFDNLSFRSGSAGKAEVDVVLQEIEFVGLLSFVEVLKDLIPFDGFSDPPYLDVTAEGLTAGFSLALPNIAVGVFNLSNISLGADVRVPFLGKAVTVGFNFCTRERPFALAVSFIGGGGWFAMRLSPDGLDVLELGLEAGAMLSVDFGVASGSISAMLGIYMRLESDAGSLTGYFRVRGEVDVLGLISASIELYLELIYHFETGKMIGRARLTIKVEVLLFSISVTIEAERRFAGSAGDPSFADVMVLEDGTSPAWSEYCFAFAGE